MAGQRSFPGREPLLGQSGEQLAGAVGSSPSSRVLVPAERFHSRGRVARASRSLRGGTAPALLRVVRGTREVSYDQTGHHPSSRGSTQHDLVSGLALQTGRTRWGASAGRWVSPERGSAGTRDETGKFADFNQLPDY